MKKVSLFLGMVLAASFAMAQNTATTVQNGDGNGATVSQSGSNTGLVQQLKGNDNDGTITQVGENDATIVQGLTSLAGVIYLGQEMTASNNEASISQINGNGNDGEVYQMGNRNYGKIDIKGSDNIAQMQQGWSGYSGGLQTYGSSNRSVLTQTGKDNTAYTWQYGGVEKAAGVYDNVNNITQTGDNNFATVAQGYVYPNNNKGITPIYGADVTGNTSNITQNGVTDGAGNIARFFQLGKQNTISLTQTGELNKVGEYTTVDGVSLDGYFYQKGNGNEFTGTQTDGATLDKTSAQLGNGNMIDMEQGEDDWAVIIQDGNLNDAYLTQNGGGQHATIMQSGNSNMSSVTQGN